MVCRAVRIVRRKLASSSMRRMFIISLCQRGRTKSSPFRRLAAMRLVPETKSRVVRFARNDNVAVALTVRADRVDHDSLFQAAQAQRLSVERIDRNFHKIVWHQRGQRRWPAPLCPTVALGSQCGHRATELGLRTRLTGGKVGRHFLYPRDK